MRRPPQLFDITICDVKPAAGGELTVVDDDLPPFAADEAAICDFNAVHSSDVS